MTIEPTPDAPQSAVAGSELSDGEVLYLSRLAEGRPIDPRAAAHLRRSWGLCTRHAAALLVVEAALQHGSIRTAVLVNLELVERALALLTIPGIVGDAHLLRRLQATAQCPACDAAVEESRWDDASQELLDRRRDRIDLHRFAIGTEAHWQPLVCAQCMAGATGPRCRPHLIGPAMKVPAGELQVQRQVLGHIARQLFSYARSFRPGYRGADPPEDRAALIEAVGWCSGWAGIVAALDARGSVDPR